MAPAALLSSGLVTLAAAPAAQALTFKPAAREAVSGGYERERGIVRRTVSGDEKVRGLPAGGAPYTAEYEMIRPTAGPAVRMLLVEAENRGSRLGLDALTASTPAARRQRSTTRERASFLKPTRLAYARVQWQAGTRRRARDAQGLGEVIMRDFATALAKKYPRRTLTGVSQGAFFVNTFLAEGLNAVPGGGRAFDHMLTIDGNGSWWPSTSSPERARRIRTCAERPPLSYKKLLSRPATDPGLIDVRTTPTSTGCAPASRTPGRCRPACAATTGRRRTSPSRPSRSSAG